MEFDTAISNKQNTCINTTKKKNTTPLALTTTKGAKLRKTKCEE
jgi:hypothetical protein